MGSSAGLTKQVVLGGSLNADADASWGKTTEDLLLRTDATLQANARPANGGTATPINGIVHARYAGRSGQLSLTESYLRTRKRP